MEVRAGRARTAGSAIKPHDVEVLVFHRYAAKKTALSGFGQRSHVKHQTPHITQKFAAHVVEFIVLGVKAAGINEDHLQKAVRQELHREGKEIAYSAEDLFALAAGVGKGNQADGFGKIRFAQKIPVPGGNLAEFRVGL
jgi:hypothetical protein